jgi:ABC-2 type transport system permease protein
MSTDSVPGSGYPSTPSPGRYGEVFDRGYAHYTGPRLGRRQAVRSLYGYSIKRALGIRKSWTAKVLPFLLYTAAIVPLIVMIGISAIAPQVNFASYSGYMTSIFLIVGIFVATTAPEMVCVDKRERILPLYFSRAITRSDYVFAKVAAMTVLTMTLSVVPSIVLWLGRQLVAESPWQAMRDNVGDLGRVILLGVLIALTLGAGGLMISSLTDRRAVAVTVITIGFTLVTAISNVAMDLLQDENWSRYFIFGSMIGVFEGIADHLFGGVENAAMERAAFSLQTYVIYVLALAVISVAIMRWRYAPRDEA